MKTRIVSAKELSAERGLRAKDYIPPTSIEERAALLVKAVKMALYIVEMWEGIPARAVELQKQFRLSDEFREQFESDMRSVAGGEELYEASKALLAMNGRVTK